MPRPSILQQRASRGYTPSSGFPWVTRVARGAPSHTRASALAAGVSALKSFSCSIAWLVLLLTLCSAGLLAHLRCRYTSVSSQEYTVSPVWYWSPLSYDMPLLFVCQCNFPRSLLLKFTPTFFFFSFLPMFVNKSFASPPSFVLLLIPVYMTLNNIEQHMEWTQL